MANIDEILVNDNNLLANINSSINTQYSTNLNNNSISGTLNDDSIMSSNVSETPVLNSKLNATEQLRGNFETPVAPNGHYIHIAYSDLGAESTELSDTYSEYLGICIDNSVQRPSSVSSYQWYKIKGEQGEQGIQGEKGDVGDTFLSIVNPLQYNITLYKEDWKNNDNNIISQSKILSNVYILDDNIPEEWKYYFNNLKITEQMTPLVDLQVSSVSETGLNELKNWAKISRAYISSSVNSNNVKNYYINFECYEEAPDTILNVLVKVI